MNSSAESSDFDETSSPPGTTRELHESPFMKACRGEPTDYTPIWLMRQAGRYMKEYREVRAKTTMLELCKSPDLATEVTVTAVERIGADAAIIFSDLLPILEPMGLELEYVQGDGPVIHNPIRSVDQIRALREPDPEEDLGFALEAVSMTRKALKPDIPLIGFAGAPFTLASYMIEGKGSRNYERTKSLMLSDPEAWHSLMEAISRPVLKYLNAQIAAGAQAVQLFDSWVGCLSPSSYKRLVFPHLEHILSNITPGAAVINFGTGNPGLLGLMSQAGGDVIGLDYRIDLAEGRQAVGNRSVQGNLDPCALLTDRDTMLKSAQQVLEQAGGRPGHIFNLGHGILPETSVDNVVALVDFVHESTS